MDSPMQDKFFCSAQNRPLFCKYDSNKCCLNCTYILECTAQSINYNKRHTIKSVLPCTEKNVGPTEICEFSC